VRAFLSTDYVAYNNAHIAETVRSCCDRRRVSVKSFVLEETHVYLKVVSEEIMDRDSGLKAGITIGNSEVGLGSVSIEPFVYRLACTNDLVVSKEQSFRHLFARIHCGRRPCQRPSSTVRHRSGNSEFPLAAIRDWRSASPLPHSCDPIKTPTSVHFQIGSEELPKTGASIRSHLCALSLSQPELGSKHASTNPTKVSHLGLTIGAYSSHQAGFLASCESYGRTA
jgi:hypothetical protein